jgi:hypothetical protein
MKNPRRFASSLPAYAFDAVAKAPSKRFPAKAAPKKFSVAALSNGVQLASAEDSQSPISSLSLVVAAGPRFQEGIKQQGIAQWLKSSGFKVFITNNGILKHSNLFLNSRPIIAAQFVLPVKLTCKATRLPAH